MRIISKVRLFTAIQIFQNVIQDDGNIPALIRLGKVCSAWHKASQVASLWRTVDLGNWTKDRFKTEIKLKWLIDNRLRHSTDVSFGKCLFIRKLQYIGDIEVMVLAHR